jgi:tRNA (guanosine-2'-O-)-methyltransferase
MNEESHPLERFFVESRLARIDSVLSKRAGRIIVVLAGVQNPHNISAVLRSADAFGLQRVFLVGESFTYSRGVSLGTERWLSLERFAETTECLARLKEEGFRPVILQAEELSGGRSRAVHELPFDEKLALVFGNEHSGVDPLFRNESAICAHIPMVGFVESLNVSVAAAITFYASFMAGRPVMDAGEQGKLREEWLVKDLRGGEQILARLKLEGVE